jgi:hypothetical protein
MTASASWAAATAAAISVGWAGRTPVPAWWLRRLQMSAGVVRWGVVSARHRDLVI